MATRSAAQPTSEPPPVAAVAVSVVIPCLNEEAFVESALESIRTQDARIGEVIVVDGGSTDATRAIVERYAGPRPEPPVRIVSARGANIAAALNAGIAASRHEVIVRIDAHSRPAPDYVRRALAALEDTNADVVGGRWTIAPADDSAVARGIARAVAHPMGAGDAAYRVGDSTLDRRTAVDTVPYGCFRKTHWERIGQYNEQLLVNEDYEFNYRTRRAGGRVVLDPTMRCEYVARGTLGALARQYFRYGWWKGRMLRQHPAALRWRQAVPALFLPAWVLIAALAISFPTLRPIAWGGVMAYALGMVGSGFHATRPGGTGRVAEALAAAAAFVVVHTAWSAGISLFFITGAALIPRFQPGSRRPKPGLSGAQLALALLVIFLLSTVAPLTVSTTIHRGRLERATRQVGEIAAGIRAETTNAARGEVVLVGPGRVPEFAATGWTATRSMTTSAEWGIRVTEDPWGNHYLIVLGAGGWVLSAGPNGIVETAFSSRPPAPVGDDLVGGR